MLSPHLRHVLLAAGLLRPTAEPLPAFAGELVEVELVYDGCLP